MRAIDLYVKVLVELAKSQVVSALYVSQGEIPFVPTSLYQNEESSPELKKLVSTSAQAPAAQSNKVHLMKFDALITDIIKICDKEGGTESEQEALWLHAIAKIYQMRVDVFNSKDNKENKD